MSKTKKIGASDFKKKRESRALEFAFNSCEIMNFDEVLQFPKKKKINGMYCENIEDEAFSNSNNTQVSFNTPKDGLIYKRSNIHDPKGNSQKFFKKVWKRKLKRT